MSNPLPVTPAELIERRAAWSEARDRYCDDLQNATNDEVLQRCARFAKEYRDRIAAHAGQGWGQIGDRLHVECRKREILHD